MKNRQTKFNIKSIKRRNRQPMMEDLRRENPNWGFISRRLNALAAIATTVAVVFAGFQFWNDREVRAVQAQLKAVELLLPRYTWRKNVADAARIRETTGFIFGASQTAKTTFDIEVFNEAGLSYRIFTPLYECVDGSVRLADSSLLRSFPLDFPVDQRNAFFNQERSRLQNGSHRLDYLISINPDRTAPNKVVFIELFFSNIAIDHRISAPIRRILEQYDLGNSVDFLSAEERFTFTYFPERTEVVDLDQECGQLYLTQIDALREDLRSPKIWEYVPVLDPSSPFGIPF